MKTKLKAIDLFAGCGGLTVGLKRAGFQVIAAVEIEPLATKTYKANHRMVDVLEEDIRDLNPENILRKYGLKKGELDLLAGCPPCQGFSSMRTRRKVAYVDDPRNDLLFEFQRFVMSIMPRAIMMENVPGLAHDDRFMAFCENLKDVGYRGEFRVLNAADYNVPQRRNRLIYLAGLELDIPFAQKSRRKKTVEDAIKHLPSAGKSGDIIHDLSEARSKKVLEIISHIPKDGGSRKDLPDELKLDCHKRYYGFLDVYGRMAWKKVAPTITSGCFNPSKGRFLHPEENRAITLREAALLQGFPPKYKFPIVNNKSAIALMIGNALPPPFISSHAKIVAKSLERKIYSVTREL